MILLYIVIVIFSYCTEILHTGKTESQFTFIVEITLIALGPTVLGACQPIRIPAGMLLVANNQPGCFLANTLR